MRLKGMHPLCCITLESPEIGDQSRIRSGILMAMVSGGSDGNASGSVASFAGVLYKWTNFGKGWRSRWFLLRNGVVSYSKILMPETLACFPAGEDVRLIGDVSSSRLSRLDSSGGRRKNHKTLGIVNLKVSSFRESKSDDKRFYIFTATKTLHLRTSSKQERVAWIQALVSSRNLFSLRELNDSLSLAPNDISVSTEKLKNACLKRASVRYLLRTVSRSCSQNFLKFEDNLMFFAKSAANIEAEGSAIHDGEYQLTKHEISSLGRGKHSECSTIESSDDVEKQELGNVSDEEETSYFDTEECFSESAICCGSVTGGAVQFMGPEKQIDAKNLDAVKETINSTYPQIERRKKLPDPVEKEKGVSLWSIIKDNVGKDLTRVCLPVYFNEPISSLQKCFEDLEYSYLLDSAYEHGKAGNSLMRALNVAAFAVSGYASSEGRHCKPFNPLLGETYEADYPEKGIRFFSEKVSHHPTLIACHCEGIGWKFWGDSNLRTKFWGTSIQLNPVGTLTLEFDDGEIFQWSKVTTSICNLILGKVYLDHHGMMHIRGNRQYSCKLKFKEQSILDRNPHQEKLPPTDSRLRPDQRHLENGEYEKANAEKLRLERRQRMSIIRDIGIRDIGTKNQSDEQK
ncbi:hypothetical protein HYC85_026848 [Camellia sinensis]|uniref:PH domain-containing protein n=1 Tax=Camellia sinensis TaxID=4442 RepID=A0A7J7G4S6_CAMSI|nr:hypothetical protein HYC85_026848 [Camellia sinensis]